MFLEERPAGRTFLEKLLAHVPERAQPLQGLGVEVLRGLRVGRQARRLHGRAPGVELFGEARDDVRVAARDVLLVERVRLPLEELERREPGGVVADELPGPL